ncbi:cytochrome c biogenesis protein ResB [Brevibacillus laterosporus]|uniref:cytochrome c biogenesis protein ResB n=1 Tax=Brevibacillus laterosporus TaxID=1465 RepID=UPI001EF335F4|nr:cytochrome c biogenesis protein ResB [Brevibacillus laterosporus]MCG7316817.1 cytochrome c biogenesis protein ResB [Brevibacillus laterosporus]MED1788820.1 cytochrome c biogenesis protein ResB [Brevibacillus laterosporus]
MDQRKCECGHTNPVGTLLCESCGIPLLQTVKETDEKKAFPDMRYEGIARRSQTYSTSVVDKVWNFFSSVKIAIIIIIITLVMAGVGTILPQLEYVPVPLLDEPSKALFYEQTYGFFGKVYYALGFHEMYGSWWFVSLLVMIGISLVICSLDRVIPLYKALNKPRLNQHLSFYKGQKLHADMLLPEGLSVEEKLAQVQSWYKKKGYRVYREGNSVLGEKARFSRWGPYVNHIGLIIFLLGVLLRGVPQFFLEDTIWVREGQTVKVPGTELYIENLDYKTEYYTKDEFAEDLPLQEGQVIPKNYQTDAVLYKNENEGLAGAKPKLMEVKRGSITVNHPLTYEGILLYQLDRREQMLGALNFDLYDAKEKEKRVGSFKIDLYEPKKEQKVGNHYVVRVMDYFPDFELGKDGVPTTKTTLPNNPMVALEIIDSKTNESERLAYVAGGFIENTKSPRFILEVHKPDIIDSSGLLVRKDTMIPLIYFGAFITMIGLVMGFYWQHRRIWVHVTNNELYLAGHTNKNWFGLQQEAKNLVKQLELPLELILEQDKQKSKKKA